MKKSAAKSCCTPAEPEQAHRQAARSATPALACIRQNPAHHCWRRQAWWRDIAISTSHLVVSLPNSYTGTSGLPLPHPCGGCHKALYETVSWKTAGGLQE